MSASNVNHLLQTLLSAVSAFQEKSSLLVNFLLAQVFSVLEVELVFPTCLCFDLEFALPCSVIVNSLRGWYLTRRGLGHLVLFSSLGTPSVFGNAAIWLQCSCAWREREAHTHSHLLSQVWLEKKLDNLIFSKWIFLEVIDVLLQALKWYIRGFYFPLLKALNKLLSILQCTNTRDLDVLNINPLGRFL